jgi:hypothetical protein
LLGRGGQTLQLAGSLRLSFQKGKRGTRMPRSWNFSRNEVLVFGQDGERRWCCRGGDCPRAHVRRVRRSGSSSPMHAVRRGLLSVSDACVCEECASVRLSACLCIPSLMLGSLVFCQPPGEHLHATVQRLAGRCVRALCVKPRLSCWCCTTDSCSSSHVFLEHVST